MMPVEKELLNFLLQDVPESFVLVIFCFVFLNLRLRWKQVVPVAVLLSLTDVIEVLPLASGVRAIIILIALIAYLKIFAKKDLPIVSIAALGVILLDILADSLWIPLLLHLSGMTYGVVYNTPYLRALFSYPTLLTILVVAYLVYRYKKKKMTRFE